MQKFIERDGFIPRLIRTFFKSRLTASAAEMAYYLIFAFFPLIMVVHASFSMAFAEFDIENTFFYTLLPGTLKELVDMYLSEIGGNGNLSFLFLGIVLTVFTLTRFMKSFKRTVRRIYGTTGLVSPFFDVIGSAIFSVLIVAAFYVSLILLILGGQITDFLQANFAGLNLVGIESLSRFLFTATVISAVVFVLYFFVPGVAQTPFDFIFGTLIASVGWVVVSWAFAFYMDRFSDYSLIYGSIGAFIMLLLWIYMSCLILLVGALFNACVYRQRRLRRHNKQTTSIERK